MVKNPPLPGSLPWEADAGPRAGFAVRLVAVIIDTLRQRRADRRLA